LKASEGYAGADFFSTAEETFKADLARERTRSAAGGGTDVALFDGVPVEIVIGRWLACCVHPSAAWRVLPPLGRAILVGAYAALGFVIAFLGLSLG
jgi:hypothetical protein